MVAANTVTAASTVARGRAVTAPRAVTVPLDRALKRALLRGQSSAQSCHDRHGGNRSMQIAVRIRWDERGRRHPSFPGLPDKSPLSTCMAGVLKALELPVLTDKTVAYTFRQSP